MTRPLSDKQLDVLVDRAKALREREWRDMVRLAWALSPRRPWPRLRPTQLAHKAGISRARVYRVTEMLKREAPFAFELAKGEASR
jgi:hypothetical protein